MANVPVTTIDATGVHLPVFEDIITYFQSGYRSIYGEDIDFDNSTQDAQWVAFIALACQVMNSSTAAAYNAFSPSTAQGTGLSSVVKINGIARKVATFSTVDQRIVGVAGTVIYDGAVGDDNGTRWNLPPAVEIPFTGEVVVTATAAVKGAVVAPPNTITSIITPTRGFQSTNNPAAAAVGQPIETDAELRQRQTLSTALPATTILEALVGALLSISGVQRVRAYENDTDVQDADGIPAHAIALVVKGGDPAVIGNTIAQKKPPGVGTFGDILNRIVDTFGIPHPIRFFRPKSVPVAFYVMLRPFRGYTQDVNRAIRVALAAHVNALGIGNDLIITRTYAPANLTGLPVSAAFEIVGLAAQRDGVTPTESIDIRAAFNEEFICDPADVRIVIVP